MKYPGQELAGAYPLASMSPMKPGALLLAPPVRTAARRVRVNAVGPGAALRSLVEGWGFGRESKLLLNPLVEKIVEGPSLLGREVAKHPPYSRVDGHGEFDITRLRRPLLHTHSITPARALGYAGKSLSSCVVA